MPSNQAWITHTYTLSGSTILTEEWTENNVDHTILYLYDANGAPLGMRYTNSTKAGTFENYLFVTNLQGDIIHIYDDAGTRLVTYNYDAWGNHTVIYENGGASKAARYNPFRYRGYYYDVETGLYYLNSRYYDPQVGRFINADSYVSTGQGLLGNNMFAYCLNNPIAYSDDLGIAARPNTFFYVSDGKITIIYNDQYSPYDIDESLYDSHRNKLKKPIFRDRLLGIKGNHPNFDFNDEVRLNLVDYSVYLSEGRWTTDPFSAGIDILPASAQLGFNGTPGKKNRDKVGFYGNLQISALSGSISFKIGDVEIGLRGDLVTAGAGVEITNKGFDLHCGVGWGGGGISVSWD